MAHADALRPPRCASRWPVDIIVLSAFGVPFGPDVASVIRPEVLGSALPKVGLARDSRDPPARHDWRRLLAADARVVTAIDANAALGAHAARSSKRTVVPAPS